MEDLAAQMQNSLRVANMQNSGRATSSVTSGVQPTHERPNIPYSSEFTQNLHPAYRMSDQVSTVHVPQPVYAYSQPQNINSAQAPQNSNAIRTQQNFNAIHQVNELRNSVQSQGRPVPVFYGNSPTNGITDGSDNPAQVGVPAHHAATLLSPPKQCDSPRMQGVYESWSFINIAGFPPDLDVSSIYFKVACR